MTGRSGAGKTTVTNELVPALERNGRVVSVLDTVPLLAKAKGERSSEGKLLRKAYVASEIVRHGGVVICVTVSARRSVREQAREIVGGEHFVEVYFDVPLEVADERRRSRGSRRSVRHVLKNALRSVAALFVERYRGGYEPPLAPEVTLGYRQDPTVGAEAILEVLRARGVVSGP